MLACATFDATATTIPWSRRVISDIIGVPDGAPELARLRDAAAVVGPAETGQRDHIRPLLKDAVVAITGWQTAPLRVPVAGAPGPDGKGPRHGHRGSA